MRTKKILMALSLVLGMSCLAAERVPTTLTTTSWSSSQNPVIVASTSTYAVDSSQLTSTHTTASAKPEEERIQEDGHSNLRLMLIGVLLIGVVALRGRKI